MDTRRALGRIAIAVALACAATATAAQVYKWTDDNGVVNYSNTPPADKRAAKGVTVVEDRVSVYTPDAAVQQATQNARERRAVAPPPPPPEPRPAVTLAPVPAPAPRPSPSPSISTTTTAPCLNGMADCLTYYDSSPVFAGRRHAPRLDPPELPAGAIAGNVNAGGGFTPGLSTQAPLGAAAPRVQRQPVQRAPAKERERR